MHGLQNYISDLRAYTDDKWIKVKTKEVRVRSSSTFQVLYV